MLRDLICCFGMGLIHLNAIAYGIVMLKALRSVLHPNASGYMHKMESVQGSLVCGRYQNQIVSKLFGAKVKNLDSMSFENCELVSVPNEILAFTQLRVNQCHKIILKRLSLYGNRIFSLPDNFFCSFPQLIWLDLRFNLLSSIPRAIKNLSRIKNLLVGHNNIHRLCLEIGGMGNLVGLNIGGNPLQFPSQNIISRGSKYVLNYLKECYAKRTQLESKLLCIIVEVAHPHRTMLCSLIFFTILRCYIFENRVSLLHIFNAHIWIFCFLFFILGDGLIVVASCT